MKVRVVKGPWGYSPRGFDHEVAEDGAFVDVPDHVAASAIEAGDVIEWTPKMAAKEAAARAKAEAAALAGAPETAAAPKAPEQG